MSVNHMHRIEPKDYERVRPIFAELAQIHLNITAILDGTCSGEVYVDDVAHPLTACMRTLSSVYYLVGVQHNHAFNAALNALLPRDTYFVLFCDPDFWGSALDVVLQGTYAVRAGRWYYTLEQLRDADWRECVPGGYSMRRIDAELLAKGWKNRDGVRGWILDEWRSEDAFFERGFGFCLVHEDDIVSWSLSDYVEGDRCEIGIQTDWDYRRKGFGTLTATATAAHAAAQGFSKIGWHCWDNNVGSMSVAENVGFEKTVDYDVFINHWAAENVTDMSQDEFRTFAEVYEREFEINPPTSGFPHIVTAKAWALSRDRDGCFRHLKKAVDLGWLCGVDHLREIWPEFFWNPNLDQMQEWQDLVKRFEPTDE